MIRNLLIATVVLASSSIASVAQAEQYVARTPAGTKVVHTRLAPVVFHRVLPPFRGQHVYQGRFR